MEVPNGSEERNETSGGKPKSARGRRSGRRNNASGNKKKGMNTGKASGDKDGDYENESKPNLEKVSTSDLPKSHNNSGEGSKSGKSKRQNRNKFANGQARQKNSNSHDNIDPDDDRKVGDNFEKKKASKSNNRLNKRSQKNDISTNNGEEASHGNAPSRPDEHADAIANNNNDEEKKDQRKRRNRPKKSKPKDGQNRTNGGGKRTQNDANAPHQDRAQSNENKAMEGNEKAEYKGRGGNGYNKARNNKVQYPNYAPLQECLRRYAANESSLVRGKLRTNEGGSVAFVSCDRGSCSKDVFLDGEQARNRALDGDIVYVELIGTVENNVRSNNGDEQSKGEGRESIILEEFTRKLQIRSSRTNNASGGRKIDDAVSHKDKDDLTEIAYEDYDIGEVKENSDNSSDQEEDTEDKSGTWQDDEIQRSLWNPVVSIQKAEKVKRLPADEEQFLGQVILVVPPKAIMSWQASELNPGEETYCEKTTRRTIVGTLKKMPGANSNRILFVPNSRCLPRFMSPPSTRIKEADRLFKAEYIYGSWSQKDKWPPCRNLQELGQTCNVEDETLALLSEFGVDHGEFEPSVLKDVEESVNSGRILDDKEGDLGWAPTPDMYKGRRDYRKERIFTIDPTTAKDLDDALHIKPLSDGRVEIGVHIADVSHFIKPESDVDCEASRRATTIYLVDRTVPMLPRPLCEIACSLNENVERLAFSCVWTMNMDGTLAKKGKNATEDVWYGKTVIKSCARLDYATAQNIIDDKVAKGEDINTIDEKLWPKSRRPSGQHHIEEVASDVRLMHKVAMARRRLRFRNGALGLNGVKLAFRLENDGKTPALCEPYPIRDSNRLIEEYMLMANYLVAQRLITHGGGLGMLRHHDPPLMEGIDKVVDIAQKSVGFHIDSTNSSTLQASLSRLGRECDDELVMQCITEMLMNPMRPAEYIANGEFEPEEWHHFALNIPYYCHFTSPIRRYPDVIVHRLLQATIDGRDAVKSFSLSQTQIQSLAAHCNEKKMASKKAQDRSDRVFLSLYLKKNPLLSTLGIVVSMGEKTFQIYVPSIGTSTKVFLDEHADLYDVHVNSDNDTKSMVMIPKSGEPNLVINIFSKLNVSCHCKEQPPIDIKIKVEGMWKEG